MYSNSAKPVRLYSKSPVIVISAVPLPAPGPDVPAGGPEAFLSSSLEHDTSAKEIKIASRILGVFLKKFIGFYFSLYVCFCVYQSFKIPFYKSNPRLTNLINQ